MPQIMNQTLSLEKSKEILKLENLALQALVLIQKKEEMIL